MGAISKHDQAAVLSQIIPRLEQAEPLLKICNEPGMPGMTTVWDWMSANPEIAEKITRARESGGDKIAEDCLIIADEPAGDMVDVQKQRLRVDTRLRLLAKWYPKRYGDKLEISGQVGINITSPLAQLRKLTEDRASYRQPVIDAEVVPDVRIEDCI